MCGLHCGEVEVQIEKAMGAACVVGDPVGEGREACGERCVGPIGQLLVPVGVAALQVRSDEVVQIRIAEMGEPRIADVDIGSRLVSKRCF